MNISYAVVLLSAAAAAAHLRATAAWELAVAAALDTSDCLERTTVTGLPSASTTIISWLNICWHHVTEYNHVMSSDVFELLLNYILDSIYIYIYIYGISEVARATLNIFIGYLLPSSSGTCHDIRTLKQ